MRDYLKSMALLAVLFGMVAAGTVVTARTGETVALARASARTICGAAVVCRGITRMRVGYVPASATRS